MLRKALPPTEWAAVRCWLRTFYAFQLDWLLDWSRFSLLLKARQIGASHTYAAACALWGMLGETTTIVSVGEREALEVLDKSERHGRALTALGSVWAQSPNGDKYRLGNEIRFASGGRIIALPATSSARGYSGNVVLDEFAYHGNDATRIWDGASASIMHGGRMRVCSTPNGVSNLFYDLWNNPKSNAGYTKHLLTIDQAREQGLRVNEEECWQMARGDARVFEQLFRCSFLQSGREFFDGLMVAKMLPQCAAAFETQNFQLSGVRSSWQTGDVPHLRVWTPPAHDRQYVVGVDPSEGTGGDAGAAVVFERGTGKHAATLWGQFRPWELAKLAAAVAKKFNHALVVVERNNHGGTVLRALDAEQRYPNIFVDRDEKPGFLTTEASRSPILDTLEKAFRDSHFVTDDNFLLSEMRTFVVNDKGRAEAAPGAHDDLVMAAAIGWDVVCRVQRRPLNMRGIIG